MTGVFYVPVRYHGGGTDTGSWVLSEEGNYLFMNQGEQPLSLTEIHGSSGGGGFFLACEDFGECTTIHSPLTHFFFFKVEISSCTLIPLFMP